MTTATLCRIPTHIGARWYTTAHGFGCDACAREGAGK